MKQKRRRYNNKSFQQRKASFADPYNETGRRKVGAIETKDRERESPYVFTTPAPFPHLDNNNNNEKHKHTFKPYENTILSSTTTPSSPKTFPRKQLVKRDTPKRLPKLEHVSGSLKLKKTNNEVIEIIAEKPHHFRELPSSSSSFINKKVEVTLQTYSKLPNLNTTNNQLSSSISTSSTIPGINLGNNIVRRARADSIKKVHELQQELKKVETTLVSEESKQQNEKEKELKQVQDNIQQLQNIHQQHHTHTKQSKKKDANNIDTEGIMQNLQDIKNIQENIHQTQSLLQGLQQAETQQHKSRNSLELDDSFKIINNTNNTTSLSSSSPPIVPKNPAIVLGSYLPRIVFKRFEDDTVEVSTRGTFFDYFWGVVLFADISGFTAVTKRLLKLGTEGLEFLKNNLSDYFDDLVSLIHEMGGDVISFSGDAVVAVWWSETSKIVGNNTERIRLARMASQCALSIQQSLSNRRYKIGATEKIDEKGTIDRIETIDELVLNLRVTVSASPLCGVHVGGVNSRWLFTAYGSAITDIAEAMAQCVIGEVIVSAPVWKLIEEFSVAKPAESSDKFVRLLQTESQDPPTPHVIDYAPEMAEWMKLYISPVILSRLNARQEGFVGEFRTVTVLFICIHSINFSTTSGKSALHHPFLAEAFPRHGKHTNYPNVVDSAIAQFAQTRILSRSNNSSSGDNNHHSLFAEDSSSSLGDDDSYLTPSPSLSNSNGNNSARLCVSYSEGLAAYVDSARKRANSLHSSTYDVNDISHKLQLAVTTIQTELLTLEGDLNKLVADDKGLISVAVFGLPPMSHEDDPLRGVLAAISIRNQLLALNMECSIGVSTGKAFCGNYGSKGHNRKEYPSVIGDSVNTAARLMQRADKHILCDSFSHKFASSKVWFENLEPIILKGYDQPVPVFKPEYIRVSTKSQNPNHQLFGRTKELETLAKHANLLQKIHRVQSKRKYGSNSEPTKDSTKLIIIEGEQGVGKSTLVGAMLQSFKTKRVSIVESISDPYKNNGPLHGIWPIFTQFLELTQDVVSNRLRVLSIVADNQNWMRLVPLLNRYLPLDFPANALCNELSDNARMESIIYIVTQMLKVMAKDKPMIVVFENAQWLDRQSWVVLSDVLKNVKSILIIALMRPTTDPVEALTLLKSSLIKIKLDLMDKETTSQIVQQQIGAKSLPPAICETIYARANGNPLMCVEVAHYLLSSGVLVVGNDGECVVNTDLAMDNVHIPSSMEAMITARIDKLLPGPLLTLKVAAIIGKTVSFKLLESIYPIPDAKSELLENLLALRKLGILSFDDHSSSSSPSSSSPSSSSPIPPSNSSPSNSSAPANASKSTSFKKKPTKARTQENETQTRNAPTQPTHEMQTRNVRTQNTHADSQNRNARMRTQEEVLAQRDARILDQVHGKVTYEFKDTLYMEVAYNSMLFSQKRQLHEQIAKWYEAAMDTLPRNKQRYLIYHWDAAGNKGRAQHYTRRSVVIGRWATLRKVLFSQRVLLRFFGRNFSSNNSIGNNSNNSSGNTSKSNSFTDSPPL